MTDIKLTKEFAKRQCIYLVDGFGNQFNILFSDSNHADSCIRLVNRLIRNFSRLYLGIDYCGNPKCPCSAFYDISLINKEESFDDVMNFINEDNNELFLYLNKLFEYYK